MKLSEIQGDRALDVLADLIEPVGEICSDTDIKAAFGKDKLQAVKLMLKNHKSSVIAIMAALDGVPAEDYRINLFTVPVKLLEIVNDPEVVDLFTSAGSKAGSAAFGSASENAKPEK